MRTTAIMKYIPAEQIGANTRRNFALNPLRSEQIITLVDSYHRNGQKEALSVRQNGDGTYELAAGHHRLAAMGGLTEHLPEDFSGVCFAPAQGVRCLVEKMDEDQMVHWMIDENSTQPGHFAGVDVDSIAAVVHRVAYLLISGAACPEWYQNSAPRSGERSSGNDKDPWEQARIQLANGTGLGVPIIRAYGVGGMSKHRVEQAIANLKALEHGGMADVIASARADYESEVQIAQAKEERRLEEIKRQQAEEIRKAKEAEKRRKDLEKQRKEAEAAKDEARIKAQRKLREKAEREERDRAERMRKAEAERVRIEKQRAAEAERLRKAKEAEEKMRRQAKEKGIHVSLLNRVPVDSVKHFRMACAGHFTTDEQPALWDDIERAFNEIPAVGREHARKEIIINAYIAGRVELQRQSDVFKNTSEHHDIVVSGINSIRGATGESLVKNAEIVAYISRERRKVDAKSREMHEEWERQEEAKAWDRKADRLFREWAADFGRIAGKSREVDELMAEATTPERQAEIMKLAHVTSMQHNLDVLESAITKLRGTFNLYRSSVAKEHTFDAKVING